MYDVFLSHSSKDKVTYVYQFSKYLEEKKIDYWIDEQGIKPSDRFLEDKIFPSIDQSNSIMLFITNNFLNSFFCQKEFDYSLSNSKKIIPVLLENVDTDNPFYLKIKNNIHFLDRRNNLFFSNIAYPEITNLINQDRSYITKHTRLLTKAIEWNNEKEKKISLAKSLLLRGQELKEAQNWLKEEKKPNPSQLQKLFIEKSKIEEAKENKKWELLYRELEDNYKKGQKQLYNNLIGRGQLEFNLGNKSKSALYFNEARRIEGKLELKANRILSHLIYESTINIDAQLVNIKEHSEHISSATYSNEKNLLASVDYDNNILVIDCEHERVLNKKKHPNHNEIIAVEFLFQGEKLLTSGKDNSLVLWNTSNLKYENEIKDFDGLIGKIKVSNSSHFIVVSCAILPEKEEKATNKVYIIDSKNFVISKTIICEGDIVYDFDISSDEKFIIIKAKKLQVWNIEEGKFIWEEEFEEKINKFNSTITANPVKNFFAISIGNKVFLGSINKKKLFNLGYNQFGVNCMKFTYEGNILATGGMDNTIHLFDIRNGKKIGTFCEHQGIIHSIDFSHSGSEILSTSGDRTAKLWDVNSGRIIQSFDTHLQGVTSAFFTRDDSKIISVGFDNTIKLWECKKKLRFIPLIKPIISKESIKRIDCFGMTFSDDGERLIPFTNNGEFKVYNTLNGNVVFSHSINDSGIEHANFDKEGTTISAVDSNSTFYFFDEKSKKLLFKKKFRKNTIRRSEYLNNSDCIFLNGDSSIIYIFNRITFKLKKIRPHKAKIGCLSTNRIGSLIAIGYDDGHVIILDGKTLELMNSYKHKKLIFDVKFSPRDNYLVSGSEDKSFAILEIESQKLTKFNSAHFDSIFGVEFSFDEKYYVSYGPDSNIVVWETTTNKQINVIDGFIKGMVWHVQFHPNTYLIAVAEFGLKSVSIYDILTGTLINTLESFGGYSLKVHFNPNGYQLGVSYMTSSLINPGRPVLEKSLFKNDYGGVLWNLGFDFRPPAVLEKDLKEKLDFQLIDGKLIFKKY